MKKLKLLIFGVLLLSVCSSFNVPKVEALTYQTLTQAPINDVYYTRRGGGQPYMSAQYNTYTMNGKVVYCIEPGVNIDTHSYVGEDGFVLIDAPYSTATNKKIELIGHYGYDYPGHQTLRYRMAAQALIWEETGGQIVEFWTEISGFGDYINLDYEKNQIMNLVNNHYDKPSFHNNSYNVVIGQEFTVTDTTGMLSQFEVYSADGLDVRIVGNTMYIKALRTGNLQLNLVRKHYDSATTIVFKGADARSQNMGYFRFSDPVTAFINIHSIGGRITLNKIDNDTSSKTTHGESTLSGAVYGLYDSNRNLVDTLIVDSSGNAISKYLELGTYYVKEITPSTGYLIDPTEYTVNVNEGNLEITVTSRQQVIRRDIEILKSYTLNGTGILTPESNITFEIYNRYNTLITSIVTDSQGYAKIEGLPYGLYRVHQVNAPSGVNKVQDFNFSVNNDSPTTIRYNIVNDSIESYLRLIKKDLETGKTTPIAGIQFKIFDITNNKYVSMKTMYPTAQIIDTFKTDANGVFITPEMLPIGHYRIEEVDQSINGYLWNKESLEFTIDGNSTIFFHETFGFILQLEFFNEQVKGELNIHKKGEELVIEDGTYTYEKISLEGVRFGLYASEDIIINGYKYYSKDELVAELITDAEGNIIYGDLPLGKYYIKELESVNDNLLDDTVYYFELKYKDQYTDIVYYTLTLENRLPKGQLEFTKTDLVNDKGLPNTKIEIYDEFDNLIFSGITDENGKIIIKDLFIGKFYLIEVEAPEGYILNTEKMWFEITTDGEIVKANMTNEKIVDVPSTGINTINFAYVGGSLLVLLGLGIVLYGKKKK